MALIQAIGKPTGAETFGDIADAVVKNVFSSFRYASRVDLVFDRYFDQSIKNGTRKNRMGK